MRRCTLYLEWECSSLSAALVYVSVPALLLAAVGYTVGLAPFLALTADVLRVATVSRLPLSAGPFMLDGDHDPHDWR